MAAIEQVLIEKIKQLAPSAWRRWRISSIFCSLACDEQRLTHAAAKASEASFSAVWDNDEDAAYDRM
jgi:hypothetical protein